MTPEQIERRVEAIFERKREHMAANPEWRGSTHALPGLDGRDQAALSVMTAFGQITNGGLCQYVDNGLAHARVDGRAATSAMAAASVVEASRDADPEVADHLLGLLTAAATVPDREDFVRLREVSRVMRTNEVEQAMYALGHDRIERFIAAAVTAHPADLDPFLTDWRPAALPGRAKHPDVTVDLSAVSANANALVGAVSEAMRRARVPAEDIEGFRAEATSGGYDKVLATIARTVVVSFGRPGPEDEDEDDMEDRPGAGM